MDELILRVALALCLAPSAVLPMQATDVLALSVAETRRYHERTLHDVHRAALMNQAMWAPESLKEAEEQARARLGLGANTTATPLPAALEAQLAALPLAD